MTAISNDIGTRRPTGRTPWAAAWEWAARPMRYRAVRAFRVAAEAGDVGRLEAALDPDVRVVVESREPGRSRARVVQGTRDAITVLVHGMAARADRRIVERSVNGQAGLLVTQAGEATALISVDFTGALVSVVWIRVHPDVLRHWNRV
ncbi:hypothetical protein [Agromyces larvae]|uniref:Siderophore-interacting protein n=1 Tax=Agromyces larvae TaxID=2929802 RepID=A0ABY4C2A5_9MICO|nr:hypothetical protein [Agromyces larvae]UOE44281.1 hypothetical protein MTO99_00325 [Agromyces larvae]